MCLNFIFCRNNMQAILRARSEAKCANIESLRSKHQIAAISKLIARLLLDHRFSLAQALYPLHCRAFVFDLAAQLFLAQNV